MQRIRNKDIADMVGVSRAAVTQVLNGSRPGCVSAEKREAILRIAREHNYHPDFAAQVLGSGKTRTIGIPVPWIENLMRSPSWSRLLDTLIPQLEKRGFMLSFLPAANNSAEAIYQSINVMLSSRRVDGLIINTPFLGPEAGEIIRATKTPVVTFALSSDHCQKYEGISSVVFDCTAALNELSNRFSSFGKTAMIYSPTDYSDNRISIFKSHKALTFFEIDRDYYFPYANAAATMVFIRKRWQELKNFRCWLLQNDRFAYAAACVIREMGLIPGKDILLAGFDNIEDNSDSPFFTTVSTPFDKMAESCVQLLFKQLDSGKISDESVKLPARIIYRASSEPVNP